LCGRDLVALGLRIFLPAVFCAGLVGCNAIDAKPEAEAVASRAFDSRRSGDLETTLSLYHEAFYHVTSKEDWTATLEAVEEKLGTPQRHELKNWKVYIGTGDVGSGTYVTLAYDVQYPNASATETLVLFSPPSGSEPRIVGHNLQSAALLNR
jgi:hypothetical protein